MWVKLLTMAPDIVGALVAAVFSAEYLFKGAKMGELKKEYVMGVLKPLLKAKNYITGGDGEADNMILEVVSGAIDAFVKAVNFLGGFGGGEKLDFTPTDVAPSAPPSGGADSGFVRMGGLFASLLIGIVLTVILTAGCAKPRTPAEMVLYQGGLTVNDEGKTYPAAGAVTEAYAQVKECMGLKNVELPEPKIIAMKGGNSVVCGTNDDGTPKLKDGCYYRGEDGNGWIVVPQGATIGIVKHEIVHHLLFETTGDLDKNHASEYFLTCGDLTVIEDGT